MLVLHVTKSLAVIFIHKATTLTLFPYSFKNVFMNRSLTMLSGIALLALFLGCEKDTETVDNPVFNLKGNANGAQETPNRVATAATGTITGTYNKEINALNYTITWTGLTGGDASAMHFHGPADPGVPASVRLPIQGFTPGASGTPS